LSLSNVQLKSEDYLQHLTLEAFAARAAHFYGELDAVHPFREGNSRTLRLFFYGLAHKAGYLLDWAVLGTAEDVESVRQRLYRARDLAVMRADSSALTEIFVSILSAL
jgi:cell filamentation protein